MKNYENTHETLERDEELARGSARGFGLVMASVFLLFGICSPLFGDGDVRIWALIVGVLFFAVAMVRASVLGPFNTAWLKFGLLLSRIVNPIVLGAMFYFVITPFGLVLRLFRKDILRLRRNPSATSYWIERRPPVLIRTLCVINSKPTDGFISPRVLGVSARPQEVLVAADLDRSGRLWRTTCPGPGYGRSALCLHDVLVPVKILGISAILAGAALLREFERRGYDSGDAGRRLVV